MEGCANLRGFAPSRQPARAAPNDGAAMPANRARDVLGMFSGGEPSIDLVIVQWIAGADIRLALPALAHSRQLAADDGGIEAGGQERESGIVQRVSGGGHSQRLLRR